MSIKKVRRFASTDVVWLIFPKVHPQRVGKPSWLAGHPAVGGTATQSNNILKINPTENSKPGKAFCPLIS